VDRDPTWGYCAFVTNYSGYALENVHRAIENVMKMVQRDLRLYTLSAYADEAFHRSKLDVVEDRGNLDGTPDDRIQEEFQALIRSLNPCDLCDDKEIFAHPARNVACLVFDEATISTLANLFFPENRMDYYEAFSDVTIKAVDIWWQCSSANPESSYRRRKLPHFRV